MDKVIRISSQQGFSDSFTNATKPSNLNLLDFVIPSGMNIDLSKVIEDDDNTNLTGELACAGGACEVK